MLETTTSVRSVSLEDYIYSATNRGESFALWRMPLQKEKNLIISRELRQIDEPELHELPPGFLISAFLSQKQKYFLPADCHLRFSENNILTSNPINQNYDAFKRTGSDKVWYYRSSETATHNLTSDYEKIVEQAVQKIEAGVFEKVVPSRYKDVPLSPTFDLLKTYHHLSERYPNAMVSLVSSPTIGTWMGATPELLVSVDDQQIFRTVSLAGTMPYEEGMNLKSVAWTEKEIEEQAFVSRYIINCFKKIRLREYEEHGPRTVVAGNLLHLKTEYLVDMKAVNFQNLGSVMLKLLHPTSAVCGMPLQPALDFLKQEEGYERELYSGYLGPVNIQQASSIFVNLRCMKVFSDRARLYAGAGVTVDSIPHIELMETEMKMKTLLAVIQNNL